MRSDQRGGLLGHEGDDETEEPDEREGSGLQSAFRPRMRAHFQ